MRNNIPKIVLLILLFVIPIGIKAQDLPLDSMGRLKTEHSSFLIGGGSVNYIDNYFSDIEYSGFKINVQKEHISSFYNLEKWIYRDIMDVSFVFGQASKVKFLYTGLPQYRFYSHDNFNFYLGAGPSISFEINSDSNNSNNVAYLGGALDLRLSGMITYSLPFENFPAMFKLSSEVSALGVSFAPEYGQNMGLMLLTGINKNNFVLTDWSNTISHKHQFSVDIPCKNITYKIAYQYESISSELNQNKYIISGSGLYVGLAYEFVLFSGKKAMNKKNLKSLIYE